MTANTMADNSSNEKVGATHIPDVNANYHHEEKEPSVGEYCATRFSTLKPPMHKAPNPIRLLRMLSGKQWLFFLVGFFAWVSPPLFQARLKLTYIDMGRIRFLHRQLNRVRLGRNLWKDEYADNMGHHACAHDEICGLHHFRPRSRSIWT